jgi:hypothetical protein
MPAKEKRGSRICQEQPLNQEKEMGFGKGK